MKKRTIAAFMIGLLLMAAVAYVLGPEKIAEALLKTKMEFFLLAAGFYLLNELVAAVSLKILTGGKIRTLDALISHMCGMFYSNATPGRVGYYYTSLSMAKKTGTQKRGNVGLLTLLQGINFLIKVLLCLIAVVYFSSYLVDAQSQEYLLLVSTLPIAGVLFLALAFYTNALNRFMAKTPLLGKAVGYIEGMQQAVREVEKVDLAKLLALAFMGWFFMSAQWYFIAQSIGADISYLTALMLQPLVTTVMFVPISPSGLGLAETGSALLFQAVGLGAAEGVAFLLLARVNSAFVDFFGIIDMRVHTKD